MTHVTCTSPLRVIRRTLRSTVVDSLLQLNVHSILSLGQDAQTWLLEEMSACAGAGSVRQKTTFGDVSSARRQISKIMGDCGDITIPKEKVSLLQSGGGQ